MKNKNLKGTLVLSSIAAGALLFGSCAHADSVTYPDGHTVEVIEQSNGKAVLNDVPLTVIVQDGAYWYDNGTELTYNKTQVETPHLDAPTHSEPVTPHLDAPAGIDKTEHLDGQHSGTATPHLDAPNIDKSEHLDGTHQEPSTPHLDAPEHHETKPETVPDDKEKPTTGKTPSQVDGSKETTPTNKTDNSIHDVKETTPTNKEHKISDVKKETSQTIKHETSNLGHAAVNQNSGVSAQSSAGSKGRSSGQAVKTVSKASDWKPSHLDRISADAEGKAAGVPLPATGDEDAVFAWAAGIFGIIAILAACTLALFNFKRYRKED